MIRRAFNRSGSEKTDAFEGAAVAGQLGSTWGDMGCTVRGKIEGHIHLLGCQQLLFVFFLAQRFLFYSVPCHLVPTVVHSVLLVLFVFVFVLVSNFCAD